MINKKLVVVMMATSILTLSWAFAEELSGNNAWNVNGASSSSISSVAAESSVATEDDFWDLEDLWEDLWWDLWSSSSSSLVSSTAGINWWYTANDSINILETKVDWVVLQSPVVKDWNWNPIKMYKVVTSTKSISESDALNLKETSFTFNEITWTNVTFTLSWLASSTTYYVVVTPIKEESTMTVNWQVSTELSFTTQGWMHAAASTWTSTVDLSTANVSYSFSGSSVTLKWTPVSWAEKIEIFLAADWEKDKTKIWDANMADWTFSFDVTKAGSYNITMMPTNTDWTSVWAEYVQKVEIPEVTAKEVKAPKVWPATDMLIALMIISSIAYVAYRYKRA